MPTSILATKLYIPPIRSNIVPRPHLSERLNEGIKRKLTIICAPAGFGKTTLLSEWVGSCETPVAWFSIDKFAKPSKFLSPQQADGVLRNFAPAGQVLLKHGTHVASTGYSAGIIFMLQQLDGDILLRKASKSITMERII